MYLREHIHALPECKSKVFMRVASCSRVYVCVCVCVFVFVYACMRAHA